MAGAYARLRTSVRPHADLLASSSSLIGTSAVTSLLGFAFWWLAARTATTYAVGEASAAVSAMLFIGTIAMFGLGTLLISELPGMKTGRWRMISACTLAALVVGLVGGLIYTLITATLLPSLYIAAPIAVVILILGIAVTAATLVVDDALIGLHAGAVQLIRNAYFAVGKLVLLGLLALTPIALTSTSILGAWVIAGLLSVIAVAVSVRKRGIGGSIRPDFPKLRSVRGLAMDHNFLNLALYLPRFILPMIVTVVVSARANAGFYTAWMIITVLSMVPTHFATALFAVARDPDALRAKVRIALLISLGIGVPASLVVFFGRDWIMGIFGGEYVALGAASLGILALTYIPTVVRSLYVAVSRATNRVRHATMLTLVAGVFELAAACVGGATGGLTRLSLALAAVFVLEGVVMAPAVIKAIRYGR